MDTEMITRVTHTRFTIFSVVSDRNRRGEVVSV